MIKTQSRWRSPILWAAIAGQLISLAQLTGAFKAIGLDAGLTGNVVAGIIQLAVIVGILNDPTNPNSL
jgi:uncharacterized membrane protein